jgi:hypothetical protein
MKLVAVAIIAMLVTPMDAIVGLEKPPDPCSKKMQFCKYFIECMCGVDILGEKDKCLTCITLHQSNFSDPKVAAIPCTFTRAKQLCNPNAPTPAPKPKPTPPPSPPPAPTPAPAPTPLPPKKYVSLRGSDSNPGTMASPFRTLQKCVDSEKSVACVMRGGRYDTDEDVTTIINRGYVQISGMPGDEPAIIDGSVAINTTWTKHGSSECVYESEPFSGDVPWQLWVSDGDGILKPLTPARFPNAKLSDLSVFGGKAFTYSAKNSSTAKGIMYDSGTAPSFASSGIDFTGTIAVIPLGTMGAVLTGVKVTDTAAGKNSFKFDPPPGIAGKGHANLGYFFEGHPKLLDAEEEWSYDTATKKLLLWLSKCGDPNKVQLRGKVRSYNLNVSMSSTVKVSDLTIFGTAFSSVNTALELDTVQLLFPTASKRTLGDTSEISPLITSTRQSDNGLSISNCTIAWVETGGSPETPGGTQNAAVFSTVGTNSKFINNLWHANGYAGGSEASVGDLASSSGMVFEGNTIKFFNTFTSVTPGLRSTIRLNEFSHQGVAADGASVHGKLRGMQVLNTFLGNTSSRSRPSFVSLGSFVLLFSCCSIPSTHQASERCVDRQELEPRHHRQGLPLRPRQ